MALCACKCLNVKLESDKAEANVDIRKLELSTTEQRDLYFSEKLLSCASKDLKIQVAQPALISQRFLGNWTMHSCLSCGQTTHAILQDKNRPNICLMNKSLQTTHDHINNLKKSKNYSPVFNLLVPEVSTDVEMKENIDTSNMIISEKKWLPAQQVISSLSKHMNQTLQAQLEAVEENVRQFRDQMYAEYEAFREKAHSDHKIISSIVSKAQSVENSWSSQGVDNGPPSPQLPPLQRRRLSSIKDAKKITYHFAKNNRTMPQEDDSLDADELFDLEGAENKNHLNSDHDYYDSEDGSNDEGIQISRPRGGGGGKGDIARSLPMTIARFPNDHSSRRELDEDDYEEPEDIAASIKALAQSVHGDAFELPRPRFSTQI